MNQFPPLRAAAPKGAKPATAKAVKVGSEQWRQPERGNPVQVDPLLWQGIQVWGLRIFSKRDPVLALERLLGLRCPRGKRAKNAERNLQIAVAVREKMNAGMRFEEAAADVAENCKFGIGFESIATIYKRYHRQAKSHMLEEKAESAMSALEKGMA
jgi:hypothetical protein